MTLCIIEVNDIGLTASSGEGHPVSSPGYALIVGRNLVIGEDARAQARLQPQQLHNRFWQRLSMDPLRHPNDAVRHHADLAYAHLQHLHQLAGKPEEVIFAVPGDYSAEQLSVLLGLAKHCDFTAVGLVDAAVAAAAGAGLSGDGVHLDLQLHQTVLTGLSGGEEIVRGAVETIEGAGLLTLYDRWAHVVADAFIEQCRFDPLYSAPSEQYLYDHMPRVLAAEDSLVELDVPQGAEIHRARIERQAIVEVGTEVWRRVFDRAAMLGAAGGKFLLSHHWAAVPGAGLSLPDVVALPADEVGRLCLAHAERIRSPGDSVQFVTRLPALRRPRQDHFVAAPAPPPPTHVLLDSTAYSLTDACYLQEESGAVTCRRRQQPDSRCALRMQGGEVRLQILGGASIWMDGRAIGDGDQPPAVDNGAVLGLSQEGQLVKLIRVDAEG